MSDGKVLKFPEKHLEKTAFETIKEVQNDYERWERSQFWGGVLTYSAAFSVIGFLLYLLKILSKG